MGKIIAVVACPTGIAHTHLAAEALKKTANNMGHGITVETRGAVGGLNTQTDDEIKSAAVVIIAADIHLDLSRFVGKKIHTVSIGDAITSTQQVIQSALALTSESTSTSQVKPTTSSSLESTIGKKVVAVTACPTGIAHTFMAAEALKK